MVGTFAVLPLAGSRHVCHIIEAGSFDWKLIGPVGEERPVVGGRPPPRARRVRCRRPEPIRPDERVIVTSETYTDEIQ